VVPDAQRGAPLADGANLIAQARWTPFALFAHESLAKCLEDGFGQAFPCGISQFACESVRFRVFYAERHISVYNFVLIIYHFQALSTEARSAGACDGA